MRIVENEKSDSIKIGTVVVSSPAFWVSMQQTSKGFSLFSHGSSIRSYVDVGLAIASCPPHFKCFFIELLCRLRSLVLVLSLWKAIQHYAFDSVVHCTVRVFHIVGQKEKPLIICFRFARSSFFLLFRLRSIKRWTNIACRHRLSMSFLSFRYSSFLSLCTNRSKWFIDCQQNTLKRLWRRSLFEKIVSSIIK